MALELCYSEKINDRSLNGYNFFHFVKAIAVPKYNDFIYRRRLLTLDWHKREEALERSLKELRTPGTLSSKMELSVQRDNLLLFGTEKEIVDCLSWEATILPPNQWQKNHDNYALISHLVRKDTARTAEEDKLLHDTYKLVDDNTPKVTADWLFCWIEDEGKRQVGPDFFAPSIPIAEEFCKGVEQAETKYTSNTHAGLVVFGFLTRPGMTDKQLAKEQQLVAEILTLKHNPPLKPKYDDNLDLNDRIWNTESVSANETSEQQ